MNKKLIVRIVSVVLAVMMVLSVCIVVISSFSASATTITANSTGYVNDNYVNLRSGAGTNYSVVTCMSKNTKFTYVDGKVYNNSWYKIKLTSNSKTGYIYKQYATVSSIATTASSSTGYINGDYVNLRSGSSTSYSVVTCMRKNTKFTFVSASLYNSSWYHIKLSDGKTGYVIKTYVTKNSSTNPTTAPTTIKPTQTATSSSAYVKLSESNVTLYKGNYYTLTASSSGSVKWSSSNTSVVTIDSHGVLCAKGTGTATIKATSGTKYASCLITVKNGSYVNISNATVSIRRGKSVLLKSSTSGVKWKSSNTSIATVDKGFVTTKNSGYAVITAYTSSGATTCLLNVGTRDNVRFTYASPNSAPLNSTVKFKAITDTDRVALRFVVSNGSTSYTVDATKEKDGNTYVWTASHKLSKSGEWTVKAYAKYKTSSSYLTTSGNGEGKVFVTTSTDTKTTVCSERRASDEVINLIADYEGFLPNVTADCITSDPTLGYGKVVTSGEQFYNGLTKNEAYAYLCQTVNNGGYTSKNNKFLLDNNIKFNQQQFDALVCFSYNVGASVIYNDSELSSVLLNSSKESSTIKSGDSGYVNDSDVNLRSGAGTSYSVVKCMSKNTKLTFVDGKTYNSYWYKIKLSDGTVGYIYKTYVSLYSSSRDLNNVNKQNYLNAFLQYHHAGGSCIWGLLYRRVDEAEVFFNGEYVRDGYKNKNLYKFTCYNNSSFSIG